MLRSCCAHAACPCWGHFAQQLRRQHMLRDGRGCLDCLAASGASSCQEAAALGSLGPPPVLVPRAWRPQERGMNAVELSDVRDCWVRNIATINADNTVLMQGTHAWQLCMPAGAGRCQWPAFVLPSAKQGLMLCCLRQMCMA